MDVTREKDLLASADRSQKHREDAAGGAVNKEEGFVCTAGFSHQFLRFQNNAARIGEVIHANWCVYVSAVDVMTQKLSKSVLDITHVMSWDIKWRDIFRDILFQRFNVGRFFLC